MTKVDLAFALVGQRPIPADHGYGLYGALSRILPAVHCDNGIAIHPIGGQQIGNRQLQLTDRSRLIIRVASHQIGELIALAGKQINLAGTPLWIGVPRAFSLTPATALRSRLVTTKNCQDQSRFEQEFRRQLDALFVRPESLFTIVKRKTLRVKDKEIVGYELIVEGLIEEESLSIQETGIGGRRHMGCGVFTPWLTENAK